jgi:excisionase family DNA binding protein
MEKLIYKNLDDLPSMLNVEQLGAVLCIGRNKTYELVNSGEIRCVKVGKQIRIPKESVMSYILE